MSTPVRPRLTERLLYAAGVIDEIGSVDDGTTQTDSLALERQRGITIKSAVVVVRDRRRHRQPDRHARPPGLHRRGRAGARRARRRGAGRLRGRGRAGADPRADARAAAAAHPDADLRQQDRPRRRATTTRVLRGDRGRARRRRSSPMGAAARARHARRRFAPYDPADAGPRRARRAARRARRRAAGRVRRRTSRVPSDRLRDALAAQTGAALGAPGVLRLGDHRRGRRRADRRASPSCCPRADGDADGPVVGHACSRSSAGRPGEKIAYVRMFSGTVADARPAAARRGRRGEGHRDQRLRPRRRPSQRAVGRRRPDRQALGPRRRPDRRRDRRSRDAARREHQFAPPTLETVVVPATAPTTGRAARRARPARRAGPADRPAPGRRRARRSPSRSTARCRRRSSRRRWPTTSASTSTFRETTTICIERPVGTGAAVELIGDGAQPVPRHRRAARRARAGRHRRRRSGSRSSSGSMPSAFFTRGRGDRARDAAPGPARLAGHRLHGDDDALRLLAAAEPRARHLRQEHVEHRPATSAA